ncbi:hypothetical protein N566_11575 [Streptomycetaceae bacterium MP113-05]|nr:hypothetical protein N566_11575 [Streptomycetaceae bacterium MP113-05]
MSTYVLRHGQTEYSKRYLVNGDPARPVLLSDEGGVRACGRGWPALPLRSVRTWLASEFPRARQTASLLMGIPAAELIVDPRLNELDYGEFEGRPFLEYAAWLDAKGADQLPPGGSESQREGIQRMLQGVLGALEHPGPRVIVGHGLLLSVLLWHRDRSTGGSMPLFFPEAPCVDPIAIPDDELPDCISDLLGDLEEDVREDPFGTVLRRCSGPARGPVVATFDPVSHSPDQKDSPHA